MENKKGKQETLTSSPSEGKKQCPRYRVRKEKRDKKKRSYFFVASGGW